ncbi:MAG: HAMP domain-containing sensor histidine kinase [Oscillospiraceae bacterium]|nr:HAMP domain-containing sensor histidine kinase [Oscillospiraceae bacterium]
MRNRECLLVSLGALLCAACFTCAAFSCSAAAGWLTLAACACLIALYTLFTLWRYRELRRLSSYLAQAYAGGTALDLRTNREGELSILKNDLYKLTTRLTQQAGLLHQDKLYLANALSDVSHQLKTPLTSLLVMNELLADPALPAAQRQQFLLRSEEQLHRIQWLVQTLLKLSRLDAAVVEMTSEETPLLTVVKKAAAPFAIPVEAKELTLSFHIDPSLTILCDPLWTQEAISNILKNAIEHTPPGGGITVDASENPLHIALSVSDTGPGFSSEDLPHLFERFYRGKNAGPNSVGIGLAMSKAILNRQNADITAENTALGARFLIKFFRQVV